MSRPFLICLLPVRNGESELAGYFRSVEAFADGVIALDDGSTDSTHALLEDHPLVMSTLRNPRRATYAGWDDAENRNRLLAEAARLDPQWILSLDADERVPQDDGLALRRFLEDGAREDAAYGFRVHRMIDDLDHFDRAGLWVFRLFPFRTGQRFPSRKLHFIPIPTDLPRSRWFRTNVRIQHLSSLTPERRRARYEKYQLADPNREYQDDYSNLLAPPGSLRLWAARDPGERVLLDDPPGAVRRHDSMPERPAHSLEPDRPKLTAIVISYNDQERIRAVLRALVTQRTTAAVQRILVTSGDDETAEIAHREFPEVEVVRLPGRAWPGTARNAGLRLARGDFVSFPGSHVVLEPDSLQSRIEAHEQGFCMVTGSVENGTRTMAGWASYFLDHSEALPGRPSGPLDAPPSHCSYLRWPLDLIGGFPEDRRSGEDTRVNFELWRLGYLAYRSSNVRLQHYSPCRTVWKLIVHHHDRGLAYGKILHERMQEGGSPARLSTPTRVVLTLFLRYPVRRMWFMTRNVMAWGGSLRFRYLAVAPLALLGTLSAALGALRGFFVERAATRE